MHEPAKTVPTMPVSVAGGRAILRDQFGFNQWANERILAQAAKLDAAALLAPDQTTHGSAFQLLLHTLDTAWGWRIICQEKVRTPLLWEVEEIPDLATLTQRWHTEHADERAYLDTVTEVELFQDIDVGAIFDQPTKLIQRAHLLAHILYHSSSHRSELAAYLTRCGHSPGDVDFFNFAETLRA